MSHAVINPNPTPNDYALESFLETSKNLLDLVRIESCVLEKRGHFTIEGFWAQKMDLLKSFEDQAARIIGVLSAEPHLSSEKALLLEEIKTIQSALTLNTAHHIKSLTGKAAPLTDHEVSAWH